MSEVKLDRAAFQKLVDEDIQWLKQQPRTLERDHIEAILIDSVNLLYGKETSEKKKSKTQTKFIKIVEINESNAKDIYYFSKGYHPSYDEWCKAAVVLGYVETEKDCDYYDFQLFRGDFDYTR